MKKIFISIMILSLPGLNSCNINNAKKAEMDDFDENTCKMYETDFFNKYSNYKVHNTKSQGSDYIENYISFCKIENCKTTDYDVLQSYQLYTLKDSMVNSTFDYELIHFKEPGKADAVIKEIKKRNCIDEITLKIDRIYRIGRNTLICSSSSNFDIANYENFLKTEFKKELTIELINPSQ